MSSRLSAVFTLLVLTVALSGLVLSGCGGGGGGGSQAGASNGLGGVATTGQLTLRVSVGEVPPQVRTIGEVVHLAVSGSSRILEVELFRLPLAQDAVPVLARSVQLAEGVNTARIDGIPAPANYRVSGRLFDALGNPLSDFQVEVEILPGAVTTATVTASPSPSPSASPTAGASPGPRIDISSTATPVAYHDLDVRSDGAFITIFGQTSSTSMRARGYSLPVSLPPSPSPLYDPAILPIGGPSPTPFTIEPNVALDDAGQMGVFWISENFSGIRSIAARFFQFSDTSVDTGVVTLATGTSTNVLDQLSADMPLSGGGKAVATWLQTQGFDAMMATLTTGGVADTASRVDTTAFDEKVPRSAQDEGGNIAVVVKQEPTPATPHQLFGYLFSNDRNQVSSFPVAFGEFIDASQLALRNGRLAVVFTVPVADPANPGQFFTQLLLAHFTYDPGNPAQVPVLAGTQVVHQTTVSDFIAPSLEPAVAVSLGGRTVVTWRDPDALFVNAIRARGFSPAGVPGTTFLVNDATTEDCRRPLVGFDATGRYVITWIEEQPSFVGRVFGRAYPVNYAIP